MTFEIDYELLPATLTSHPMTDDEFAAFCADHPDLFFEMSAEGEIIVMPPTYTIAGFRNIRINRLLDTWAERDGRGLASDAASGFVLPNGARRSPDSAWTLKSRIAQLSVEGRNKYSHLCPDFVIELLSDTDRPRKAREKMKEWIDNGAQLGWLIDPQRRTVAIYRPNGEVEVRTDLTSVAGEGPIEGFVLELSFVWDPYGTA